jgi:hypothetical protein
MMWPDDVDDRPDDVDDRPDDVNDVDVVTLCMPHSDALGYDIIYASLWCSGL